MVVEVRSLHRAQMILKDNTHPATVCSTLFGLTKGTEVSAAVLPDCKAASVLGLFCFILGLVYGLLFVLFWICQSFFGLDASLTTTVHVLYIGSSRTQCVPACYLSWPPKLEQSCFMKKCDNSWGAWHSHKAATKVHTFWQSSSGWH